MSSYPTSYRRGSVGLPDRGPSNRREAFVAPIPQAPLAPPPLPPVAAVGAGAAPAAAAASSIVAPLILVAGFITGIGVGMEIRQNIKDAMRKKRRRHFRPRPQRYWATGLYPWALPRGVLIGWKDVQWPSIPDDLPDGSYNGTPPHNSTKTAEGIFGVDPYPDDYYDISQQPDLLGLPDASYGAYPWGTVHPSMNLDECEVCPLPQGHVYIGTPGLHWQFHENELQYVYQRIYDEQPKPALLMPYQRFPNSRPELAPILKPAEPYPSRWEDMPPERERETRKKKVVVPILPRLRAKVLVATGPVTMPVQAIEMSPGISPRVVAGGSPTADPPRGGVSPPHPSPPKKREKERKVKLGSTYGRILMAANTATEWIEVTEILWDHLPARFKTRVKGRRTDPFQQLKDLYRGFTADDYDLAGAIDEIIENEIQDALWAGISKKATGFDKNRGSFGSNHLFRQLQNMARMAGG